MRGSIIDTYLEVYFNENKVWVSIFGTNCFNRRKERIALIHPINSMNMIFRESHWVAFYLFNLCIDHTIYLIVVWFRLLVNLLQLFILVLKQSKLNMNPIDKDVGTPNTCARNRVVLSKRCFILIFLLGHFGWW